MAAFFSARSSRMRARIRFALSVYSTDISFSVMRKSLSWRCGGGDYLHIPAAGKKPLTTQGPAALSPLYQQKTDKQGQVFDTAKKVGALLPPLSVSAGNGYASSAPPPPYFLRPLSLRPAPNCTHRCIGAQRSAA